jgi:hypothetical protein
MIGLGGNLARLEMQEREEQERIDACNRALAELKRTTMKVWRKDRRDYR